MESKLLKSTLPTQLPAQLARSVQPASNNVSLAEEFKSNTANTGDDRQMVEKIFSCSPDDTPWSVPGRDPHILVIKADRII